jgi:hypothetical protein
LVGANTKLVTIVVLQIKNSPDWILIEYAMTQFDSGAPAVSKQSRHAIYIKLKVDKYHYKGAYTVI